MAIAPAASKYGKSSTFATAISFLTGLKTYHDDKTRKKRNEPKSDSFENDSFISLIESLAEEKNISNIMPYKMVGRTGFEPVTNWLKANCSTSWASDPHRYIIEDGDYSIFFNNCKAKDDAVLFGYSLTTKLYLSFAAFVSLFFKYRSPIFLWANGIL